MRNILRPAPHVLLALTLVSAFGACSSRGESGNTTGSTNCNANVSSDPNNCGACGHVCPNVPGAAASCVQGACVWACQEGYADCNGDLEKPSGDGCEAHLATDPMHCGTCSNQCPSVMPPNAAVCSQGTCSVGCAPNYGSCSGNGCTTDLLTDPTACGECDHPCASGVCLAGVCKGELQPCQLFPSDAPNPVEIGLASDGTHVALAYSDSENGGLWLAGFDSTGHAAIDPVRIASVSMGAQLDVAFDGMHFVVAWSDSGGVHAQRFAPDTLASAGPAVVASGVDGSVALAGGHGATLIASMDAFSLAVSSQLWTAGAAMPSAPAMLTTGQMMPSGPQLGVAVVSGGFMVAWPTSQPSSNPGMSTPGLAVAPLDATGAPSASVGIQTIPQMLPGQQEVQSMFATPSGSGAVVVADVLEFASGLPIGPQGTAAAGAHWAQVASNFQLAGGGGDSNHAWVGGTMTAQNLLVAQTLDASGAAAGAPVELATVGFPVPSIRAAPTSAGTLFVWVRSVHASPSAQRLESLFLPTSGALVRACN